MLAQRIAAAPLLASLAFAGGCAPAYFRDVPPSFVSVDHPLTEIAPSPRAAKVVLFDGNLSTRGSFQTFTIVKKDGTVIGQVAPKSWIVVDLPPGETTLVSGIPEIGGVRPCSILTADLQAGKIYVLLRSSLGAPASKAPIERTLSLLSRMRVDGAAGQARVREQWDDFWKPCIAKLESRGPNVFVPPLGEARTELRIPPPP